MARFGARYGRGIKLRALKVETKQKAEQECRKCGFSSIKRLASGLFHCSKCNTKFAGGAYTPTTTSGEIVSKMVTQKKFLPYVKELTEAKEGIETEPEEAEATEEPEAEEAKEKEEKKEKKSKKEKKEKKKEGKKKEKKGKKEEKGKEKKDKKKKEKAEKEKKDEK